MKKKLVLTEEVTINGPFPIWKSYYKSRIETLGNQVCQFREYSDMIHEKTKGNLKIILKLQPGRNKPHLKGILFNDKSYFNEIKIV